MKNITNTLFAIMLCLSLGAQDSMEMQSNDLETETCTLTVSVAKLGSNKGKIMIALYNEEGKWLKSIYASKSSSINGQGGQVVFENIPYGVYAISTFHDENENGELDAGWFGIPKEPYMSSRGEKGKFGPPKWEKAKFEIMTPLQNELINY